VTTALNCVANELGWIERIMGSRAVAITRAGHWGFVDNWQILQRRLAASEPHGIGLV